jgi:hypothetical protein
MEFADRDSSHRGTDGVHGLLQDLSNMKLTEENLMLHTQRAAELSPQRDIIESPCRIITMSSRGVALTGGDFIPKRFADVESLAVLVTGWPQELSLEEKDALLAPFSAVGSLHSWVPAAPDGEQPWEETALVIFGARLHATKACSSKKLDSRLTARPVREASPEMLAVLKKMPLNVPAGPKLDSTAAARVISFTLKQRDPAAATAAAERIAAARMARESAAAAKLSAAAASKSAAAGEESSAGTAAAAVAVPAAVATAVSSAEASNEQPAAVEERENSTEQPLTSRAAGDHNTSNSNDAAKRSSGRGRGRSRRSTAGVKANGASASAARDGSNSTAAQDAAVEIAQHTAPDAAPAAAHTTEPTNSAVSAADRSRGSSRGGGRRRRAHGRGRSGRGSSSADGQSQQQQQQQSSASHADASWS